MRVLEIFLGILLFPIFLIGAIFVGLVKVYQAFHAAFLTAFGKDEF